MPDLRVVDPEEDSGETVSRWDDYGGIDEDFVCREGAEFCHRCGRQMVESVELTGQRSRRTGQPTYARFHSCPTWVTGWRTRRFLRAVFCPGMGHDSHDADLPLSSRGYR